MKSYFNYFLILILLSLIIISCKTREKNYIIYYNKVNEIDSIYRIAQRPKLAIKKFRKLFKEFPPKNQERIEEFENYIYLSDKYQENFGGKKNLYKFITLIAPYRNAYQEHLPLFKKYGIDSLEAANKTDLCVKSREKVLLDSITTLFVRDQEGRRLDINISARNDLKNAKLMKWIFDNYGYPSLQKVGVFGNDDVFLPMSTFFSHMSASQDYPYFEKKLKRYLEMGDCTPREYSTMVDRYHLQVLKDKILYGSYIGVDGISDTIQVNKNRKSVGLPSLKHNNIITKDFLKKLNKN
ncbi:hypothetical protein SDC9_01657 [bioreactor metagenome]|uniref:Lipoprotein n=1 Tax=bioreactor metagenome TaxID=1076179 RepID=A0A644SNG6_9ZZZZ